MSREQLGQMLLAAGQIKHEDLASALAFQSSRGGKLGMVLVRMGALSEPVLFEWLATQLGYPLIRSADVSLEAAKAAWDELSGLQGWLFQRQVLPWQQEDGSFSIACADPLEAELRETLLDAVPDKPINWHLMLPADLERWMLRLRDTQSGGQLLDAESLKVLAEDAPVIAFVNNIISQAVDARASDIHLEPGEREFTVRLRIDGVLHKRASVPMERFPAISSRVKLISHLDIAERRLPQDGRVSVRAAGQEMDIRVSAIPAVHGESLVMRLLPKHRADLRLDRLGMSDWQLTLFRQWLDWPNGLILVTGPTGSGKSTTLYGALAAINDATRKIITVEDPVEFRLPDVVQIQTQADIGYTFARALRSILRHDPDIIMIGEIRDRETAEIAIQSALTGHLVLATLHTNDALSAITRLIDMGIEPYLVAAALRATMAQRLVRRLCRACAVAAAPEDVVVDHWRALEERQSSRAKASHEDSTPLAWMAPRGCEACGHTGFRGRLGLYELVTIGGGIQGQIAAGASPAALESLANAAGRISLREDGIIKAARGLTTYPEILRAAGAAAEL